MSGALTAVYLSERPSLIWSVMRIVRDVQTAEDLAQETYLRAKRAMERGPIEHLDAFLYQTARNLALDHLRRRKTRSGVEADGLEEQRLEAIASDAPSVEQRVIDRDRLRALQQALAGLPERAQLVVMLSRIEAWPNPRIAEHLGVSQRTVFNDLKLAMAHCRARLSRLDGAD